MVTGVYCLYSINGRVELVAIYKRGRHYYGFLGDEKFQSVEQYVADLLRTGFTMNKGRTSVTLTNQLFPNK